MSQAAVSRRVTFGDVLANREFRAMYVAQALSVAGDQLARIAVAILVFNRSHSALLTGLTYAISYLPWVVGGPLLAGYADRLPRRRVMIVSDLVRAALILCVAIPGLPLAGLLLLITLVSLMEPPFAAARAAMLPDVVGEGEHYAQASTLANTTNTFGVVVGFAVGGAIVGAIGARPALVLDAFTFALSAMLIAQRVRHRPAADAGKREFVAELRQGAHLVFGDAYLRWLVVISWLIVAVDITTESIAVPYASVHGGGATTAGLLTAALPLGTVVGALLLARAFRPAKAQRLMMPMALATPVVISFTAFNPPNVLAGVLWFVGGVLSAVQVVANRVFVASVVREFRGRAFGIAAAGISTAQGLGALISGAIAQRLSPAIGVADVALPAFAVMCVLSLRTFGQTAASRDTGVASNHDERADQEITPDGSADQVKDEDEMPGRTGSSRPETRIWLLNAGLVITAAVVSLMALPGSKALVPVRLPVWWFFLLFTIAIAFPLHFVFKRQPWSIHLEAVPLVLGLFFLSPLQLVAVHVAANAFCNLAIRRQPSIRLVFNTAAAAIYTLCAIGVFRMIAPASAGTHVDAWAATFTAVAAYEILGILLVSLVVYMSEGIWTLRQSGEAVAFALASGVLNTFLALTTAAALSYDANTAWSITVFVVLSIGAVRTYHRLAARHAALDKLYAVARELGPMAADPADLAPALTQLRRIVEAEVLEFLMLGEDPDFATVITVFDHEAGEGLEITERELDPANRQLLLTPAGPRATRPARRLLAQRQARRLSDRIAVPVGASERPVAVLVAQTRSGNIRNFDQADIRLLEAAADQLSAALEKGRLVESLRRAATRDSLTNLANLDSLREFLATMLDGSAGGVLLLLDIDRFHEINDTLGHDAGDRILQEVAHRLESAPTHGALVARVGGDQFALAIPGQAGGEVARLAALAVKSRVDGPIRFEAVSADMRITVGMSRAPEHGTDPATLLRRAEMAMTEAKGSSSGIGEWEPSLERDGSRRLQLLAGLRQALSENQLTVEFQPKIMLGSGEVGGFESLVRWRHPELGAVSPAEFVPLAEASGLISALTSGVLRMSLDAARRWHDAGYRVGVAVNISARSLDDPVLVGQVAAMLTASGVESRWLTLEITESSVMENPARSLDVLLQLRSLGLRLSIDDFGTGYSSLHQLRGLPVHEVKIDKAFVDEVDGDGADRAVVRAIVELCDSLGLVTVAEGVERATQAYALESLGVSQVQGYFYGRPMPEPAATEWLMPRAIAAAKEPPSDVARG
jgi:diguanylate cyclase (GGDEF)-like protein